MIFSRMFKLEGKTVRMDSKLIGSNIAWYSRYQIVHETLCLYLKAGGMEGLNPKLRRLAEKILEEDAQQIEPPYRYFDRTWLEGFRRRKEFLELPQTEKNKRNNVEASIFQYCFQTRNNKTRYRGLMKHKLYSYARCMWINARRLMIFQIKECQRTSFFIIFRDIAATFWHFENPAAKMFRKFSFSDWPKKYSVPAQAFAN